MDVYLNMDLFFLKGDRPTSVVYVCPVSTEHLPLPVHYLELIVIQKMLCYITFIRATRPTLQNITRRFLNRGRRFLNRVRVI